MKEKTFQYFTPGTAEYVVHHGLYRMRRGLRLTASFQGIRNARKALVQAIRALAKYNVFCEWPIVETGIVIEQGWIREFKFYEWDEYNGDNFIDQITTTTESISLIRASLGKEPVYCDNSRFYRVESRYVGQIVQAHFESYTKWVLRDLSEVCLADGTHVPVSVEQPLAFERWGRSLPFDDLYDPSDDDPSWNGIWDELYMQHHDDMANM